MNIFICEDNVSILDDLRVLLTNEYGSGHSLFFCADAKQLRETAQLHQIDLLISDIELPDGNGLDLATELWNENKSLKVIFITAFPIKYYEEMFDGVKPYASILKPIKEHKLIKNINEVIYGKPESSVLRIKYSGIDIDIPQEKICYIESHRRIVEITTESGKFETYFKMNDIQMMLDDSFIRCHVSYIINPEFADGIEPNSFCMRDGRVIAISRKHNKEARRKYFEYKGNFYE